MALLPLSSEPFALPTDRDMLPSERRLFVNTHRTCVLGYARQNDGPAQSIVYYIPTDDGQLLIAPWYKPIAASSAARLSPVATLLSTFVFAFF